MNFSYLKAAGTVAAMAVLSAGGAAQAGEDNGLGAWVESANEAVDKVMHYPRAARKYGYSGRSTFSVTINRDGDVVESDLLDSTGRIVLRAAAKDVLRKADFPALPSGYDGEELRFALKLNYQIAGTADEMRALQNNARVRSEKISAGTPVAGRITILSQAD